MKKGSCWLLIIGLMVGLLPLSACAKQTPTPAPNIVSLEEIATTWVNLLVEAKFDQAVESFDKTMAEQISAAILRETWSDLIAQVGVFKGIVSTRTSKQGIYDLVFVTCNFKNATLDIQLTYDADRKVAGLFFRPVE